MQGYWLSQESPKELEAKLSAIKLLSVEQSSSLRTGGRHTLILKVGLKMSFLIKLIVRIGLPALSYAAIGLDCQENMP